MKDVLTQQQVNDLPDGTPVVVLHDGSWQRGFRVQRQDGIVHAALGKHLVYPLTVGTRRGVEVFVDTRIDN